VQIVPLRKFSLSALLLGALSLIWLTTGFQAPANPPAPDPELRERWVDSVYQSLSEAQRIGQLMMLRAYSNKGNDHTAAIERMIRDQHIGGLCFFQGSPAKQAELTNRYQKLAGNLPLLIAMDAEWGLGMRLKEHTISFPYQLALGAIRDNHLIYQMGAEIAWQCRRLGVHVNFAPVADVNNNADNPVINYRSFGEDRMNVAAKSYMYALGMQDHGVLACAKHFPGHGDTDVDSHYDLPVILHNRERLDSIELFPFKVLAEQGVGSMMIAHLQVPALDSTPNLPTTLSRPVVTGILREAYGYDGLVFTDGLGMKGVTKYHKPGRLEVQALLAGNDVLLLPEDLGAAIREIQAALASGELSQARFEQSVKRVLRAKYDLGLTFPQQVEVKNIEQELNHETARVLNRKLIQESLTLLNNPEELLPLRGLDSLNWAALCIGAGSGNAFHTALERTAGKLQNYSIGKDVSADRSQKLVEQLSQHEVVVVSLHGMSNSPSASYGVTKSSREFIEALRQKTRVVLVVFGNPYALAGFEEVPWILQAYADNQEAQELAADAVLGVHPVRGKLPVTASPGIRAGMGVYTAPLLRLGYARPADMGVNELVMLRGIDSLAQDAIRQRATPGCVVLVARSGNIIFEKAYGHHDYSRRRNTKIDDIFDLASITKIAATTLAVMKMYDDGLIDLHAPIGQYIPALDSTNKQGLIIADILSHMSGLAAWIPFYQETVDKRGRPLPEFYQRRQGGDFTVEVASQLYMHSSYRDTIWQRILDSRIKENPTYVYSDLGFILLARLVEEVTGTCLEEYMETHFYQPMSLETMTFNPLKRFPKTRIPPTEDDNYFRQQEVQGYVHDMGAAMFGGVAGHAGLFSSARDLAVLMQMLLNKGYYDGRQFLQSETVDKFTRRCNVCNRRGLGFDLKTLGNTSSNNIHPSASEYTYGHLGFTGTCIWVDPVHELIFIVLSNRTYPSMKTNLLSRLQVRPNMQGIVYQALHY
jgi:beta-N-acetylhexosaminidase